MNVIPFVAPGRCGGIRGEPAHQGSLDAAWMVLEAANDLGDLATVESCRRVIDANLDRHRRLAVRPAHHHRVFQVRRTPPDVIAANGGDAVHRGPAQDRRRLCNGGSRPVKPGDDGLLDTTGLAALAPGPMRSYLSVLAPSWPIRRFVPPAIADPAMPPIISVANLSKTYGSGFKALNGINLEIHRGEIFALLGPNGAGKTTLISIICGIANPSAGSVIGRRP